MHARGLARRVRRLEQTHAPRSPVEKAYGSLDAFIAAVQADIDTGQVCRFDGPILLESIKRWHRENVWAIWR